ncbi:MAG: SHOCT domain-containing protein [Muricomes sp.]
MAEKVAQNEGIGNFSNAGIGLGMMGGVAGGMGVVVAGITNEAFNPVTPQSGPEDMDSFKRKLDKLKLMKEEGILTDEEFNDEKKKLLSSL